MQEQCSIVVIKPIYKASYDDTDHRGITLLSRLAKLFAIFRLTLFVDNNGIIGPQQKGFKPIFQGPTTCFLLRQ